MKREDLLLMGLTEEQVLEVFALCELDGVRREPDGAGLDGEEMWGEEGDEGVVGEAGDGGSAGCGEEGEIERLRREVAELRQERELEAERLRAIECGAAENQKAMVAAKMDALLMEGISLAGGRSPRAIEALLDREALMAESDPARAIKKALCGLKESDGYLFAPAYAPPALAEGCGAVALDGSAFRAGLGI